MLDSFDITEDVGETGLIRDDVYLKVRADILTCTLMPGSLLQEKELAERYSVGRSPVRDALLRLQEQGLVKILPRKGYRVLPISLGDAQDLYDMRILLEKLTVFKSIRDRYDGKQRNSFCESESANRDVRSTANYNALLALSGFH